MPPKTCLRREGSELEAILSSHRTERHAANRFRFDGEWTLHWLDYAGGAAGLPFPDRPKHKRSNPHAGP